MKHIDDRYDNCLSISDVLYDEVEDGYICSYCRSDFTYSQLDATYGGDVLPNRLVTTRKTARTLHSEPCLICDLPCDRFLDD
jgi:hypothetical protein